MLVINEYVEHLWDKLLQDGKEFNIYGLTKEIFDESIHNFILAFVDEDKYNNYINETQPKIDGTGSIIELMNFEESMTIKKNYISVNEKIFTKHE